MFSSFGASIIESFDRSEMKHSVYLLLWLDHKRSSMIYFLKKINYLLLSCKSYFKLPHNADKFVTPEISESRQNNLSSYSALTLANPKKLENVNEDSISKPNKSHCKNSYRVSLVSSLNKLFTSHYFRKGFFMIFILYTLFHHFIVSVSRSVCGCLFGTGCRFEASLVNFNRRGI